MSGSRSSIGQVPGLGELGGLACTARDGVALQIPVRRVSGSRRIVSQCEAGRGRLNHLLRAAETGRPWTPLSSPSHRERRELEKLVAQINNSTLITARPTAASACKVEDFPLYTVNGLESDPTSGSQPFSLLSLLI